MHILSRIFLSTVLLLALGLHSASAATETLTELRGYKRTFKLNNEFFQMCKDKWKLDADGDHASCHVDFFSAPQQNALVNNEAGGVDREFRINGKLSHTVRIWPFNSGVGIGIFVPYGKKLKSIDKYSSHVLKAMAELNYQITVNTVDSMLRSHHKFVIKDEDLGAAKLIERIYKFSAEECIANWKPLPGPYANGRTTSGLGYCNVRNFNGEFLPGRPRNGGNFLYDFPVVIDGQNFTVYAHMGTYSLNVSIFPGRDYSDYTREYDVSYFADMLRSQESTLNAKLMTFPKTIISGELQESSREPGQVVGKLMDSQIVFAIDPVACKNTWSLSEREPNTAYCSAGEHRSKSTFFNHAELRKSYSENVLWKEKSINSYIQTDAFQYDLVTFGMSFKSNSKITDFSDFAEMFDRFSDKNNGYFTLHRNVTIP